MYEDDHLEMDYEDRYTIQGDYDSEDKSYFEDVWEENQQWFKPDTSEEDDESDDSDEEDFHYDSPSLQDIYPEMPSYGS